jgi:hypothetical protein
MNGLGKGYHVILATSLVEADRRRADDRRRLGKRPQAAVVSDASGTSASARFGRMPRLRRLILGHA